MSPGPRRTAAFIGLVAVLVLAVSAAAYLVVSRAPNGNSTDAATSVGYRVARQAASTTAPADASWIPLGWPSNVDRVSMTRTTHQDAMRRYFDGDVDDAANVIVVQMIGRFVVITKGGVEDSGPGGILTVVADPNTGSLLDLGVSASGHTSLIANATVLFRR